VAGRTLDEGADDPGGDAVNDTDTHADAHPGDGAAGVQPRDTDRPDPDGEPHDVGYDRYGNADADRVVVTDRHAANVHHDADPERDPDSVGNLAGNAHGELQRDRGGVSSVGVALVRAVAGHVEDDRHHHDQHPGARLHWPG